MKKLIASSILSLISTMAMAGEFYVLEVDQYMSGQSTLKLRQKLKQQYPGIELKDTELMSVMMVAKSKQGRGKATLKVGQALSSPQTIGGAPSAFHSEEEFTYDRALFLNPKGNSKGKWQIQTRGKFNVSQVVVEIDPNPIKEVTLQIDQHLKGQKTVKLRNALNQQTSMNAQDYEIVAATVIGKSKQGGGKVQLKVGQALSQKVTLAGSPNRFHSNAQYTFSAYEIENPKNNSNGVWQLKTNGNIKIQDVILSIKKK